MFKIGDRVRHVDSSSKTHWIGTITGIVDAPFPNRVQWDSTGQTASYQDSSLIKIGGKTDFQEGYLAGYKAALGVVHLEMENLLDKLHSKA